jgi:hypothetical protein
LTLTRLCLVPPPAARTELEAEVEQHYRTHASEASRLGSADVAAEYQSIKAEVEVKTAKIASECEVLTAQLQVQGKRWNRTWPTTY